MSGEFSGSYWDAHLAGKFVDSVCAVLDGDNHPAEKNRQLQEHVKAAPKLVNECVASNMPWFMPGQQHSAQFIASNLASERKLDTGAEFMDTAKARRDVDTALRVAAYVRLHGMVHPELTVVLGLPPLNPIAAASRLVATRAIAARSRALPPPTGIGH